jgi:hypothetical protein
MRRASAVRAARALLALLAFSAIALGARSSSACVDPATRPHHVVSVRPTLLFARGVGVAYERFLPTETSVFVTGSYRSSARGDFDSSTVAAAVEGRWWPFGAGVTGCRERYEMVDLYLGLRFDAARTSLHDRVDDRDLGASYALSTSAWLGWRFALGALEITPATGTMIRTEIGGGLAAYTSVTVAYDLTIGWMF